MERTFIVGRRVDVHLFRKKRATMLTLSGWGLSSGFCFKEIGFFVGSLGRVECLGTPKQITISGAGPGRLATAGLGFVRLSAAEANPHLYFSFGH